MDARTTRRVVARHSYRKPPPLLARPVAGEIDYAALTREHMERYPVILAYLRDH